MRFESVKMQLTVQLKDHRTIETKTLVGSRISKMDQKIVCSNCKHFEVYDEQSIKKFNEIPESYDCPLCHFNQPGRPKYVGNYYQCGFCSNVSRSGSCSCQESLESEMSTIKITYNPLNQYPSKFNRVNEKEQEVKSNLEFNKLVRNKKLDKIKREEHIEQLLVQTVDLLAELAKHKEVKSPVFIQ